MEAEDVLGVLAALNEAGVRYWVAGGWGVAALTGRQTRRHRDLDLALDAADLDRGFFGYPRYPPDAFSRGLIAGRTVPCLSERQQRQFRTGYQHRPQDIHDLALLDALHDRAGPQPRDLGSTRPGQAPTRPSPGSGQQHQPPAARESQTPAARTCGRAALAGFQARFGVGHPYALAMEANAVTIQSQPGHEPASGGASRALRGGPGPGPSGSGVVDPGPAHRYRFHPAAAVARPGAKMTIAATPGSTITRVNLPEDLVALLRQPSPCFLATVMPDGSPQMTQTWVDTDGEHVVINTVQRHQKVRNVERDPRVAVNVCDASRPSRYYAVRGQVVGITTDGGAEHIEALAQRYLGTPYPWYGGRDQGRVILTIKADKLRQMG